MNRFAFFVVDDFAPFRETLCSVLLPYESMVIIGEAADGEAAIELAFRLRSSRHYYGRENA